MKALWAYEPFHQDEKRIQGMHRILKQLVAKPSNIEIGFIVTRHEPSLHLAFDIPPEERFSLYPRELIKRSLKASKVTIDNKKIHIVDYETLSDTKSVDQLLKLAKARNADLIALNTHSRQGFERLVLGSFAETAIHRSRVNLLLVNPRSDFSQKIKNVFFMTDFSPASKKHFKQVVHICKQLKASLTVFHAAEVIYKWSLAEGNPKVHAYRRKVTKIQSWIEQECRGAGIKCAVIVNSEMTSVTEAGLKSANKYKSDLIVVVAKSGAMTALMGGSITRQVVRKSAKPVLILK